MLHSVNMAMELRWLQFKSVNLKKDVILLITKIPHPPKKGWETLVRLFLKNGCHIISECLHGLVPSFIKSY